MPVGTSTTRQSSTPESVRTLCLVGWFADGAKPTGSEPGNERDMSQCLDVDQGGPTADTADRRPNGPVTRQCGAALDTSDRSGFLTGYEPVGRDDHPHRRESSPAERRSVSAAFTAPEARWLT